MEMIFVFTHLIMIICSAGIIYISLAFGIKDEKEKKKNGIPNAKNRKSIQVVQGSL
jgi:hypothetical protein